MNYILSIVFLVIAVYLLLFYVVPKKTIAYEILRLPIYLFKALTRERNNMIIEKHRFGKHWRQYLLFFQPKQPFNDKKHIIMFHHGGGWQSGSPEMFKANAQFFANRGYHVFMPSYRRTPFNRYPEIREDISLGLKKAVEIMKAKGLQGKKIILAGMSAGGNLVALLLYNRPKLAELGLTQHLFGGIVLFGAPLELNAMAKTFMLEAYAGKHHSDMFQQANPINYLEDKETIPVLCVHGTHDGMVPFNSATAFAEKMSTINPDLLTFYTIDKGTHLETGSWLFEENEIRKALLKWLEDREKG